MYIYIFNINFIVCYLFIIVDIDNGASSFAKKKIWVSYTLSYCIFNILIIIDQNVYT